MTFFYTMVTALYHFGNIRSKVSLFFKTIFNIWEFVICKTYKYVWNITFTILLINWGEWKLICNFTLNKLLISFNIFLNMQCVRFIWKHINISRIMYDRKECLKQTFTISKRIKADIYFTLQWFWKVLWRSWLYLNENYIFLFLILVADIETFLKHIIIT